MSRLKRSPDDEALGGEVISVIRTSSTGVIGDPLLARLQAEFPDWRRDIALELVRQKREIEGNRGK